MSKPGFSEMTDAALADEAREEARLQQGGERFNAATPGYLSELLTALADRLSPVEKQFGAPVYSKFGDDPASTEAMRGALEGDDAK